MVRSIRALLLFWTIFGSYGWQWLKCRLSARFDSPQQWDRVHGGNARRLAQGFMRLRGVFIKLGQVLSVLGGFLPKSYGSELELLQDQVPPHSFREIKGRLVTVLGKDWRDRFASFDEQPIAAASLAQVHHALDHDGRALAVKILYPGVDALIRRDLRVLRMVVPVAKRMFGFIHVGTVLGQLTVMLSHETQYDNERANMARLRDLFRGRTNVVIPEVIDALCGDGVLTMSFEEGRKITDFDGLAADGVDREAVARLLVDCYFTMLFRERIFHADPHPGNFIVRPVSITEPDSGAPVLVILDHGAVEPVTESLADGMQMVLFGALMKSDDQILRGLERMGFVAPTGDRAMLADVGRKYLAVLGRVRIEDFSRMDKETLRKLSGYDQTRGKLRELMRNIAYPEGFFYVERTLVLLFGLVGRLAPTLGLPGLVAPLAMQAMAGGLAAAKPAASADPRS